ncbi:hypothetical protein [Streptomyces xanthophaeus]
MTRHHRFALLAAAACVLATAFAAPQAVAAPAGICALVKGEPGLDKKSTYDLKLSGFDRGARVTISGGTSSQNVRVASNGKYVDEDVTYGTYTVKERNRNTPPVTCSKVPEEPAGQADPQAKTADVTSVTAKYLGKQGDIGCIIFPDGVVPGFDGTISTSGPGTVKYRWTRSDGLVSGAATLTFTAAGSQNVPKMSWDGVALKKAPDKFTGWAQITIVGEDAKSNRADVSLTCVD